MFFLIAEGIYEYQNYSLLPQELDIDTEILIIVITRSSSQSLRNSIRKMYSNAFNGDTNNFNLTLQYKLGLGLSFLYQFFFTETALSMKSKIYLA